MPFISSWFIRFFVAKVPWLQVSSIAKVLISLLDSLNLNWYHAHTENLTRANCCTLSITGIGTIILDYL